jgi:peptidoglycan/LPS O-acetylase OafA/YrhL
MNGNRRYFDTLDALRFLSFVKIFLLHLPITAFHWFNYFREGGDIGVSFFFVLSGFLITYFLLEEKTSTGKIQLKKFYLKRFLRIWPLYYLMVAFAFCTSYILDLVGFSYSNEGYYPNWWMTILFLENYQMIQTGAFPNVSPLVVMWTLCVEEHFYIIWGLLLYFIRVRFFLLVLLICIILSCISRYIFISQGWMTIELSTNLIYFSFGAIPAYLLVMKKARFEHLITRVSYPMKYLFIFFTTIYVLVSPHIIYPYKLWIEPLLFGILFSTLIAIVIPLNSRIRIGKNHILTQLGLYSYGLYLYHTIIINLLVQLFFRWGFSIDKSLNAVIFTVVSMSFTILISLVSYWFFERYFLRWKTRLG